MEKPKKREIYECEFHRGTTAAETARRVNAVFGEGSTAERTVRNWFAKFRNGDFNLKNKPRRIPDVKVNNDALRVEVESNPSQTLSSLSRNFNVSKSTIKKHLAQIGKIRKAEKWVSHYVVSHELSNAQKN